jgi:hypothetical protein
MQTRAYTHSHACRFSSCEQFTAIAEVFLRSLFLASLCSADSRIGCISSLLSRVQGETRVKVLWHVGAPSRWNNLVIAIWTSQRKILAT